MGALPKNKITRAERGKRRHGNRPNILKDTNTSTVPLHKRSLVADFLKSIGLTAGNSTEVKAAKSAAKTKTKAAKSDAKAKAAIKADTKPSKPTKATTARSKTTKSASTQRKSTGK